MDNLEITIDGGLRVKINQNDSTASVIKSPEVKGTVIVPRFVEHDDKKYKIISISDNSFYGNSFDYLTFPEDSDVEIFEHNFLAYACIKTIRIPPKLKFQKKNWLYSAYSVKNEYYPYKIEVSPQSQNYKFSDDDKYLLAKSEEDSDTFDVLFWVNRNVKEAVIPAQVRIIGKYSFKMHSVTTITFSENSKLKRIESEALVHSSVEKLTLPASLEDIDDYGFSTIFRLSEIVVSPKNKFFKVNEHKYLLKKSSLESDVFDVIVFVPRNIVNAIIPSYIKMINSCAFYQLENLKTITFDQNSSLEIIKKSAFFGSSGLEKIVFPPSLNRIEQSAFSCNEFESVEFLGKSVTLIYGSFGSCKNLTTVSFPNADEVFLDDFANLTKLENIFVLKKTKINITTKYESQKYMSKVKFIDDEKDDSANKNQVESKDIETESENIKKETKNFVNKNENNQEDNRSKNSLDETNDVKNKDENSKIVAKNIISNQDEIHQKDAKNRIIELEKERHNIDQYVEYLQSQIQKYTKFVSFEEFMKIDMNSNYKKKNNDSFIGIDDEEFQTVVSKIGEGATSEVFKIIDTRTGRVMCKKVIKETCDKEYFKTLQNSMKEIEIVLNIKHQCICEGLGYNLFEELPITANQADEDEDEEEQNETKKQKKTTIALFFEYLPYSVKNVIENNMMNNTLKVKIILEVAFGMNHIHSLGMIHRDLKLENIMMNNIFEAKIIDFGLVRECSESQSTLTKGVGTLAYMSPEMLNEENYDMKTDVYSYGIVLFALFTGRLPKQTMRERLDNVPLKFPKPSGKISEYCINLIKWCTSFKPNDRPSFDQIIEDMKNHSFELASEIDSNIIFRRYFELNDFSKEQAQAKKSSLK